MQTLLEALVFHFADETTSTVACVKEKHRRNTMAESYREMEMRHAVADEQVWRQEYARRWAGPSGYYDPIKAPSPATVRDCTTCHNGDGSTPPNCTLAHIDHVLIDGEIVCSGGVWGPRREGAA